MEEEVKTDQYVCIEEGACETVTSEECVQPEAVCVLNIPITYYIHNTSHFTGNCKI